MYYGRIYEKIYTMTILGEWRLNRRYKNGKRLCGKKERLDWNIPINFSVSMELNLREEGSHLKKPLPGTTLFTCYGSLDGGLIYGELVRKQFTQKLFNWQWKRRTRKINICKTYISLASCQLHRYTYFINFWY